MKLMKPWKNWATNLSVFASLETNHKLIAKGAKVNKNQRLRPSTCEEKIGILKRIHSGLSTQMVKVSRRITKARLDKKPGEVRELESIMKSLIEKANGILDDISRYTIRSRVFGNELVEVVR